MQLEKKTRSEIENEVEEFEPVDLAKLKKELGYGWSHLLQKNLRKPNGKKYQIKYIRRALCFNSLNKRILVEAILFKQRSDESC